VPGDDRATEALGHLQRAVLEMIGAARAALDLVEDLVADPQSLAGIVATVGHMAQAVVAAASAPHPAPTAEEPDEREAPAAGSQAGVERIPVV
jgi:hypothetical protein